MSSLSFNPTSCRRGSKHFPFQLVWACCSNDTAGELYMPFNIVKRLVEWVCAGAPVGQEKREADCLEDSGDSTNGNGVKRALLGDDLGDDL
jgi:hypothetical protein